MVILKSLLMALTFWSLSAQANYPVVPDPQMTPGDLCSRGDRDFEEYRYAEKIPYCRREVDRGLKSKLYDRYGIPSKCRRSYTIDHFYPLSMGGNNSSKNLWPEHRLVKQLRIDLELEVFEDLRDGHLKQQEALDIIHEAKTNPPLEKLNELIQVYGGNDCDRAALEAARGALTAPIESRF